VPKTHLGFDNTTSSVDRRAILEGFLNLHEIGLDLCSYNTLVLQNQTKK